MSSIDSFGKDLTSDKKRKNPLEQKGIIWNSEIIQQYHNLMEKGLKMKNMPSPYYNDTPGYKKANLIYEYSEYEMNEIIKCKNDVIYFANTYCHAMTTDGVKQITVRKYQEKILSSFQNYRNTILLSSRQIGKCVYGLTKITIKENDIIKDIPIFELYYKNKEKLTFLDKIKYKLYILNEKYNQKIIINIIEFIEKFQYRKMCLDSNNINKKILDDINLNNIEVLTDDGYKKINKICITQPYNLYSLKTKNHNLLCADNHIIFDENYNEIFVKDSNFKNIHTISGIEQCYIDNINNNLSMFDIEVDYDKHRYYTNGILSHNTLMSVIFLVWYALFHVDRNVLVVGNKLDTTVEILDKMYKLYEMIPFFLKPGLNTPAKTRLNLENGCRVIGQATSTKPGLGFAIHMLYADEFAHVLPFVMQPFWTSIYPTVSADPASKIIISSTANGLNLFHDLWSGAIEGQNDFNPVKVDWWEVDGRDETWRLREIANFGENGEEKFNQEYGNQFLGTSELLLDVSTAKLLQENIQKFKYEEIYELEKFNMSTDKLMWNPKEFDEIDFKNDDIVLTVDIADGIGRDYSIINIFKYYTYNNDELDMLKNDLNIKFESQKDVFYLKQIGLFRDNNTPLKNFIKILEYIVFKVFNAEKIKAVVEVNFKGDLVINQLIMNALYEDTIFLQTMHNSGKIKKPGVRINGENKKIYLDDLRLNINERKISISEMRTIDEFTSFGIDKRGKYVSQTGNDDILMSCMLLSPLFKDRYFEETCAELFDNLDSNYKQYVYSILDDGYDFNDDGFTMTDILKNANF